MNSKLNQVIINVDVEVYKTKNKEVTWRYKI